MIYILLLIFIAKVTCEVNVTERIAIYKDNGFGFLSYSSDGTLISNPIFSYPPSETVVWGISLLEEDSLVLFGQIFFQESQSLIIYNITSEKWTSIELFGLVENVMTSGKTIFAYGRGLFLQDSALAPSSFARCDFPTGRCEILPDYSFIYVYWFQPLPNNELLVFCSDVAPTGSLILFNSENKIVNLGTFSVETTAFLDYDGWPIIGAYGMVLSPQNVTTCGSIQIFNFAKWNGECFDSVAYIQPLSSPFEFIPGCNIPSLFVLIIGTSIQFYDTNNDSWIYVEYPEIASLQTTFACYNGVLFAMDPNLGMSMLDMENLFNWTFIPQTSDAFTVYQQGKIFKSSFFQQNLTLTSIDFVQNITMDYNISCNGVSNFTSIVSLQNGAVVGIPFLIYPGMRNIATYISEGIKYNLGNGWNTILTNCSFAGLQSNGTHVIAIGFEIPNFTPFVFFFNQTLEIVFPLIEISADPSDLIYSVILSNNTVVIVTIETTYASWIQLFSVDLGTGQQNSLLEIKLNSSEVVMDLYVDGTELYIFGSFNLTIGDFEYTNVAKLDLETGNWIFVEGVTGNVIHSLLACEENIYIFGDFYLAGDIVVSNAAMGNTSGYWTSSLYGGISEQVFSALCSPEDGTIYFIYEIQYPGTTVPFLGTYNNSDWNQQSTIKGILYLFFWPIFDNIPIEQISPLIELTKPHPLPPPNGNSLSWWNWLLIAIALLCLVLLISGIIWRRCRSRNTYIKIPNFNATGTYEEKLNMIKNDPEIPKIQSSEITFKETIGSGGQGTVYKAIYNLKFVAAKSILEIFVQARDSEAISQFLHEVKLHGSVKHKFIVGFYGVHISDDSRLWMISELMQTTLAQLIPSLSFENKKVALVSIAKAMRYLHHKVTPPVIHRDLKPENILVNSEGVCKIADFGLGRLFTSTVQKSAYGTRKYMAPEVHNRDYTMKVDIWSYGIVLAEVLDRFPFDFTGVPEFAVDYSRFLERTPPMLPQNVPTNFVEITADCLRIEPERRPTFIEIVKRMTSIN